MTAAANINALLTADRIIGSQLATRSPGLILSIDIGGSFFDCIADSRAQLLSHRFVRFPSLLRYRSQLNRRSTKTEDVPGEPVLLARTDGALRIVETTEALESYDSCLIDATTRSIDSWCKGRAPLGLLHLGDPTLLLDQLSGAADTLARDRPTLTLYTTGVDVATVLAQLQSLQYCPIGVDGRVVDVNAADDFRGFGLIAIPSERVDRELTDSFRLRATGHSDSPAWQQEVLLTATRRQMRLGTLFGLPAIPAQLHRMITAAEIVFDENCFQLETNGSMSWRWCGPKPETRIIVPCPFPGRYRGEVYVLDTHAAIGLGDCRILVEGREIYAPPGARSNGIIPFLGELDAGNYAGYMTIDLIGILGGQARLDDSGLRRINIHSVTMSPWY